MFQLLHFDNNYSSLQGRIKLLSAPKTTFDRDFCWFETSSNCQNLVSLEFDCGHITISAISTFTQASVPSQSSNSFSPIRSQLAQVSNFDQREGECPRLDCDTFSAVVGSSSISIRRGLNRVLGSQFEIIQGHTIQKRAKLTGIDLC